MHTLLYLFWFALWAGAAMFGCLWPYAYWRAAYHQLRAT